MPCTHIVECLREKNIEPETFATSWYLDHKPENALKYEQTTCFYTSSENKPQWWTVDFKQRVLITSYFIKCPSAANWISQWNLSVSNNNESWTVVDEPAQDYPRDRTFIVEKPTAGRYAKVFGSSPLSSLSDKTHYAFNFIKFNGLLLASIYQTPYNSCKSNNYNILLIILLIYS